MTDADFAPRADARGTVFRRGPDSPISRGRLCPKGAATRSLVAGPGRELRVKYRRPHGTEWEELALDQAMDMIAERVIATREATWQPKRRRPHVATRRGHVVPLQVLHQVVLPAWLEPKPSNGSVHRQISLARWIEVSSTIVRSPPGTRE